MSGVTLTSTSNDLKTNTGAAGQVLINLENSGASYGACTGTQSLLGLDEGRQYYVRVLAFTKHGYSLPSSAVSEVPARVPDAPLDVRVEVLSSTSTRVIFSKWW